MRTAKFYKDIFHVQAKLLTLGIFMVFVSSCHPNNTGKSSVDRDLFAYDLESPDAHYKLPSYLVEISGLSYYGHGKIACIQDEKGSIYILNLEKGKIINEYRFGNNADYEDIAIAGKTAYVLRNDGQIFRVENFRKKDHKVKKFKTPLKEQNNTEGMAFDALSNSLLITCKGSPSIGKENLYKGYKAVYKFDLEKEKMNKTPVFLIDLEKLDTCIDQNSFTKLSIKFAKKLRFIESETNFQPSGIAIHPLRDEIYIISSVGKLLIIINYSGKVLDVQELDAKIFRQPEGICFSPSGDLFISSEGGKGKGYVLKFNFNSNE